MGYDPLATAMLSAVASGNKVGCVHSPPLIIASEAILAGRTEVQIRHRREIYRLTLTPAGKLILHECPRGLRLEILAVARPLR